LPSKVRSHFDPEALQARDRTSGTLMKLGREEELDSTESALDHAFHFPWRAMLTLLSGKILAMFFALLLVLRSNASPVMQLFLTAVCTAVKPESIADGFRDSQNVASLFVNSL
jgi:hypothetical protein